MGRTGFCVPRMHVSEDECLNGGIPVVGEGGLMVYITGGGGVCVCIVRAWRTSILRSVEVRILFLSSFFSWYPISTFLLLFSEMAFLTVSVRVLMLSVAFLLMNLFVASANAQAPAPAPMSDGTAIDQGIAYVLLFLALALTYLIHPLDAFPFNLF